MGKPPRIPKGVPGATWILGRDFFPFISQGKGSRGIPPFPIFPSFMETSPGFMGFFDPSDPIPINPIGFIWDGETKPAHP